METVATLDEPVVLIDEFIETHQGAWAVFWNPATGEEIGYADEYLAEVEGRGGVPRGQTIW